jgi:hypothetical protein
MRKVGVVLAVLSAMAIGAPAASAQTTPPERTLCRGELTGVIQGDVFVPRLASCVITQAIVKGNVATAINAVSLSIQRSIVDGSVDCGQCRAFTVDESVVAETLNVRESSNGARVCASAFGGDATLFGVGTALDVGNTAGGCGGNVFGGTLLVRLSLSPVTLEQNVVATDLTAIDNRESLALNRNLIGGELGCENNNVPPTGSGNFASSKSGQCEGL